MIDYLLIGLGGALGSVARVWVWRVMAERFGHTFPLGTLAVNVSGSFAIGFFVALTAPGGFLVISPRARDFFTAGVCGGYTTFSAFSVQTLSLAREGKWLYAGLNVMLSVALCLLGVWLGYAGGLLLAQRGR